MSLLVDGRRALLAGLVDYAGMFPPASLDLADAMAEYRTARTGRHAWMLGRFLCPASRLEDLAGALTSTMQPGEARWSVGAVLDGPVGTAATAATAFHRHMEPAATVDTVELRTAPEAADGRSPQAAVGILTDVVDTAMAVSPTATPYLELAVTDAWNDGLPNAVTAVADLRERRLRQVAAKLRTGGVEPAAFPTPEQVARFIAACTARGVPFKATAGLHHPVRHHDPELDVMRHGFLNLLMAAALGAAGVDETELVAVLAEGAPEAFVVGAAGLRWAGHHVSVPDLRRVRGQVFPAYGSCSFDEPVADLIAMGIVDR